MFDMLCITLTALQQEIATWHLSTSFTDHNSKSEQNDILQLVFGWSGLQYVVLSSPVVTELNSILQRKKIKLKRK